MGKKSRNKKSPKKQLHATQVKVNVPAGTTPASLSGGQVTATVTVAGQPTKGKQTASQLLDMQTQFIRSDIVRIVLLLVAIGVVLGILFMVNDKTTYLRTAGDKLGSFLKL